MTCLLWQEFHCCCCIIKLQCIIIKTEIQWNMDQSQANERDFRSSQKAQRKNFQGRPKVHWKCFGIQGCFKFFFCLFFIFYLSLCYFLLNLCPSCRPRFNSRPFELCLPHHQWYIYLLYYFPFYVAIHSQGAEMWTERMGPAESGSFFNSLRSWATDQTGNPSKPRSSIIYLGFKLILAHKLLLLLLLCVFSRLLPAEWWMKQFLQPQLNNSRARTDGGLIQDAAG